MMALLSYVPWVNRLVPEEEDGDKAIDIPPVEVHSIETVPDKTPRTLKHLLRANHVNHSIIYHNLQFDNHMPHILCSAYLLGAESRQLYEIYDAEAQSLEPWTPSPSEITQDDWRDFLGDKRYQRAYVDFFEDALAMEHAYDWKKVMEAYMLKGKEPLVNGLIGGLGHPLIHLGYAYEMDNREIAMEALGLAATQYNFLHKYVDDPSYTRKSLFSSASPTELLNKLANDGRFNDMFQEPGFGNIEPLFQKHEPLVLEYWNAWDLSAGDPVKQFQESQEAAVALLVATVPPGTHSYNFFIVHLLTTSHAVRILLPFLPAKFHMSLARQWWLLTLAVYIAMLRPPIDPDYIRVSEIKQKEWGWGYVEKKALNCQWSTDAHFIKAIRAMREAARTWGDVHERYLASAAVSVRLNPATLAMVPPAKRRKRTVVDESEDEDGGVQQSKQQAALKRFLFSSPDAKQSTEPTAKRDSPSPTRKRSTRAAAKFQSTGPAPTLPLPTRSRSVKAPTKSPSTTPEKSRSRTQKAGVEEKGKTADLVTLFSNQAQRSQSANSKKISKPSASQDIISDPISDDDDVPLCKTVGSSLVGKNAKKRTNETPQSGVPPSSAGGPRFAKPTLPATRPTPSTPTCDDDSRPWSERFAPVNLDELAVHKKKVADVRRWLEDVFSGRMRQRLLVLKGAAGTGKTTTVQLLAKDMRCEVLEWRNPANSFGAAAVAYQSASAQFEEFLGRGSKFGQLDLECDTMPPPPLQSANGGRKQDSGRKLLLIEEFPNTFMRSSTGLTSFRNAILQFLAANMPALSSGFGSGQQADTVMAPIVMVISETLLTTTSASADSFTAHRLLGPEILRHPGTGVIEFNNIAPTLLARALELVVQKEARRSGRRRTPGPLVLKRLGEIGDIRNAISSLEFLCVKGDGDADWGSKIAFTKPKRGGKDAPALTKGEQDSLELVSQREASLGIFHAVGKVVYNKREERPSDVAAERMPDHMAQLSRPKRSEVSVDTLIDETGTDTHTFISALHENYALSCEQTGPLDPNSSLDYLNGCLEYLSESDLLCPSWDIFFGGSGSGSGAGGFGGAGKDSGSHVLRQDEMAFQVAVRGLLFSLPSPVKRQSHPGGGGRGDAYKMFYPAYLKLWRAKEELQSSLDVWATHMLKGEEGDSGPGPPAGSNPFSRKASTNHATPAQQLTTTKLENAAGVPPLLSLGNAARQELLLERLPYMAHIARRRRNGFGSMRLRDLEKIVSFSGIGPPKTDDESDSDPDDTAGIAGGESWATDKPTDESPRKRRSKGLVAILGRSAKLKNEETGAEETGHFPIDSLVLSDDDIEDD
ncbi:cell cycle checkpoint protein RAD17 [Diplogelasinospora grovesii]|uniref:Cell cycle checkpoint protein RAD17 n=1 Tax=Diplogelasinospora grovesii TaxID=303347 RepID=A0AAN6S0R0_9PEZI|nr:cell cycle checkpoint protein RAD17 [Diplogelasinospora grovesii]